MLVVFPEGLDVNAVMTGSVRHRDVARQLQRCEAGDAGGERTRRFLLHGANENTPNSQNLIPIWERVGTREIITNRILGRFGKRFGNGVGRFWGDLWPFRCSFSRG